MHSHIPKESFCLPVEVKWDLQLNKHEHTHTHTKTHTKAHECYTYQQKMKQTVPRCLPAQVRRVKSCKDSDLGPKQQTHAVAHFPGLEKNLHVAVHKTHATYRLISVSLYALHASYRLISVSMHRFVLQEDASVCPWTHFMLHIKSSVCLCTHFMLDKKKEKTTQVVKSHSPQ